MKPFRASGLARLFLIAGLAHGGAAADDSGSWNKQPRIRAVLTIGGDFGFKDLVQVQFSSGETRSLKANQGLSAALASIPTLSDGLLETRATIGVKYASIDASNGDVTWLAFPIELLEFYHLGGLGIGGGVTYELARRSRGAASPAPSTTTSAILSAPLRR